MTDDNTSRPVVAFPMYDFPFVQDDCDTLWFCLREALHEEGFSGLPQNIRRTGALTRIWSAPGLFLSQCCGADLLRDAGEHMQYVATPVYDIPEGPGGYYCSRLIVSESANFGAVSDLYGHTACVNDWGSHSGCTALAAMVAPYNNAGRFFSDVSVSGSHAASIDMVRSGQADAAGIDAVTMALIQRHRPEALKGVRVLSSSRTVPAPPFVTGLSCTPEELAGIRVALGDIARDPAVERICNRLLFSGLVVHDTKAYTALNDMRGETAAHGYDIRGDVAG